MADDVVTRPRVSRRREVSHTSARSVLMTVLGEYVLPHDAVVWTQSLVEALGLFGIEEKSARQALARTAGEGWLRSERIGRRVRWSLTEPGRKLLSEGAERIYGFGSPTADWDGRWVLVLVSVPESKRDLRHRLRTRLSWAGFGSPTPGVWISPDPGSQAEAQAIMAELDLGEAAMSFVGDYGRIGDEASMVARAWDLRELERRYAEFVAEFAELPTRTDPDILRAQTRLVHEWRRFPFLDPRLPMRLLPADWSGVPAAELFHRRHTEWRGGARREWARLTEQS